MLYIVYVNEDALCSILCMSMKELCAQYGAWEVWNKLWTTRVNILCGNSLGSKTNKDVRMYT